MRDGRWRMLAGGALGAALLGLPAAGLAQQVTWVGSVQPRFEVRDEDGGDSRMFTGMQTRLGLARALGADARVFFQLQDARIWGEEASPADGTADALDLHQGYVELGHRGGSPFWLRVGRQEMEFANGRLVGSPPWALTGQSFDGVRGAYALASHTVVDFFGVQIREAEAGLLASDAAFFGVWSETDLGRGRSLQLFALHDRDAGALETERTTAGTYYTARAGIVDYRVEGAYQTGKALDADVTAWMAAAEARIPLFQGRGEVAVAYDRYSGDATPDPGESGAFSDLFGRNHRFFGFADLFSEVPEQTEGRGLQDLAVRVGWNVVQDARLGLDVHRFVVADDEGLDASLLADEVDLTLAWPFMDGVEILAGGAYVLLGDAGTAVGLADGDLLFGYLQLRASF